MLRSASGLFLLCVAATAASAQSTEAERRKMFVPYARATSDCFARESLASPDLVAAVKSGTFEHFVARQASKCTSAIGTMIEANDRIYGPGLGREFYNGPYLADVARAVRQRIGPAIAAKIAEADRDEAATRAENERVAEAQRVEMEAARQRAAVAAEQRKAEDDRRTAELKTVALKAEADKRVALDEAKSATTLLKQRFYECAQNALRDLVRSGETATVLASASLTVCSAKADDVIDSAVKSLTIEAGASPGRDALDAVRDRFRGMLKEELVALAVKARADRQ